MIDQQIFIRIATCNDMSAVVDLITAQEHRLHALDSRLRIARPVDQIASALAQQYSMGEEPLVACDEQGRIRGCVQPALWTLPPESELLAFFPSHNGIPLGLTLPSPSENDASIVLSALLNALNRYWKEQHTSSAVLRWPSCDLWLEPLLGEHGFLLDSDLAYYPPLPLVPARRTASSALQTRLARRDDEEILIELFQEELRFHLPYTPFVHLSHDVTQAFRSRLARIWTGETFEEGAPLVIVVERGNEIVAMAESDLLILGLDEEPNFLPSGRYGHLNNVSVRNDMRGQGVGHTLVQAVFNFFETAHLDGYLLWFNPDNPLARSFWLRLGFLPVWRTYQRPEQR